MSRSILISFVAYLIVATGVATWVYHDALRTALADDRETGQVRLSEATSRLRGQLDIFRALVNIIAATPRMAQSFNPETNVDVRSDLTALHLTYGAWEIDLVNPDGQVVASSSPNQNDKVYSSGLVWAAKNGRLGYAIELEDGRRLIRFSRRISGSASTGIGLVVVSADLAALEFEWPIIPEPIIFFDVEGLSMSSNRPGLLLMSNAGDPEEARFPVNGPQDVADARLWKFAPANKLPHEVQILSADIPQLQLTAKILLNTRNTRATVLLRTGLAVALLIALALIGAIFVQQRRRLALESRHSATLEQRVEERTVELQVAQDELVKSSNLAALGRLSAGVSHELNQPLAAILNFADNGRRLIDRSRTSEAAENLTLITDQIRRITRIIGNLRAFARQEHTPTDRIDLNSVVKQAITLTQSDVASSGVTLNLSLPEHAVFVMAGKIRLEQVVLNLVSNALDAMQTIQDKTLTIVLEEMDEQVMLSVRDSGTGIQDPTKVFEPFYTTKELGSSKGLGMGLALSFGLVASFGGNLSCRNLENGAEFIVTLPVAGDAS
ncbi:MAG: hypothetical protein HN725_19395 [Alphaproteobacteria bacterium]|jgi:two-component system, NtrC family, C4-dicarboxylate transport sensor histidine kinase DctB|nr:hypothetical protein [Alphaproteobacteria bacterium]MBT4542783.1 hypothetical protein [Alphaproteobacteria bacterium]MBT7747460.1 hypothetical protein [Alphaproteobacteria bacterium]